MKDGHGRGVDISRMDFKGLLKGSQREDCARGGSYERTKVGVEGIIKKGLKGSLGRVVTGKP